MCEALDSTLALLPLSEHCELMFRAEQLCPLTEEQAERKLH